jgi:hypothetical protein
MAITRSVLRVIAVAVVLIGTVAVVIGSVAPAAATPSRTGAGAARHGETDAAARFRLTTRIGS